MNPSDYWIECVSEALAEVGIAATSEQITTIATAVEVGHDNYGQAFYSPPASDMYAHQEREWESRYKALEKKFQSYQDNAETAVRKALRQHDDASVSIGDCGEVYRHGGRTERIQ